VCSGRPVDRHYARSISSCARAPPWTMLCVLWPSRRPPLDYATSISSCARAPPCSVFKL